MIPNINLAVCILFFEKIDQTLECIKSFLPSNAKIYILNNGSSEQSSQALRKFCEEYKQITIFESEVNLGVSGGRNYILNHTVEDWLFSVDNDITVRPDDWLQRFANYANQYKQMEVFIPRLFQVHENVYKIHRSIRIVKQKAIMDVIPKDNTVNFFPGGASFINRKLFSRLGTYDEKMFTGFQDYELCIRGILAGDPVRGYLINEIELIHDHRQSKKKEDVNSVMIRYSPETINNSYNRIIEKHGITLVDEWRNWIDDQVIKTVSKKSLILYVPWNRWIPNLFMKMKLRTIKRIKTYVAKLRIIRN